MDLNSFFIATPYQLAFYTYLVGLVITGFLGVSTIHNMQTNHEDIDALDSLILLVLVLGSWASIAMLIYTLITEKEKFLDSERLGE